jgi:hypothetical protein
MKDAEISTQLRTVISQYGYPSPEMTPRFRSLLQDVFVDNPREMNLLIAGLEEGLPGQLLAKKGMVPFEVQSRQMVDRLNNVRGIDRQAAEWVVRTWAEAMGYDIPAQTPAAYEEKQSGKRIYQPYMERKESEIISKGPEVKHERSKIHIIQPEKYHRTIIALGIVGLGIGIVILFAMAGGFSSGHISSSSSPSSLSSSSNAQAEIALTEEPDNYDFYISDYTSKDYKSNTLYKSSFVSKPGYYLTDERPKTYKLNSDFEGLINIHGSDFILNGNGHTITTQGDDHAIFGYDANNIEIMNFHIIGAKGSDQDLIDFEHITNSKIHDNSVTVNGDEGNAIRIYGGNNNEIINNFFNGGQYSLIYDDYNVIKDNTVTNLVKPYCSDFKVYGEHNTVSGNTYSCA